jgi:DNA-binding response OmpR family regulator
MHQWVTLKPSSELAGQRILVVEDEALVAMLVEDGLTEAGAKVIGPARSVDEAMTLIETSEVTAAVLDVNLGGERVTPVAERLSRMRVPFVFATGYAADCEAGRHAGAPVLQKPFDLERLTSTLVSII